jgi:hypothetical protein
MGPIMPDRQIGRRGVPSKWTAGLPAHRPGTEVVMCNFELSPELFRQRRVEMIALADERRLARAMKPARVRTLSRRRARARVSSPVRLNPSPVVVT